MTIAVNNAYVATLANGGSHTVAIGGVNKLTFLVNSGLIWIVTGKPSPFSSTVSYKVKTTQASMRSWQKTIEAAFAAENNSEKRGDQVTVKNYSVSHDPHGNVAFHLGATIADDYVILTSQAGGSTGFPYEIKITQPEHIVLCNEGFGHLAGLLGQP